MLTIEPAPVAESAGNAAREQRNAPPRVVRASLVTAWEASR